MNIEVRYYSKSGNTKKIADAIAKQAGYPQNQSMSQYKAKSIYYFQEQV